jgi:salicylate hydroxylase
MLQGEAIVSVFSYKGEMVQKILISGGGIGGLAAALACARGGATIELFERATEFAEVGAGVQLGPNVVKILHQWGLKDALASVAAFPERLQVRSATSGDELGVLRLGEVALARYGSPYVTIHRADLHGLLLDAVKTFPGVALNLADAVSHFEQSTEGVAVHTTTGRSAHGELLVGADGGWSLVRQQLLKDGVPKPTGHLAYRAMVLQSTLPLHLRSQQVTAWLGPKLHVVQYPVRGGEWLNVVAIVHGHLKGSLEGWDHGANAGELRCLLANTCAPLLDLVHAIDAWRLWGLSIRAPMRGAFEMANGRVALLGDAAHPMLPYLAQGAGMAIEDAHALGLVLENPSADVPALLAQYAQTRWARNARVQARAIRNGEVFHATGPMRLGRDAAMKLLGERLLDVPWLYGGA